MQEENLIPYNLRLPEKLKEKVTKEAKDNKRSLNKHIVFVLEQSLSTDKKDEKEQLELAA